MKRCEYYILFLLLILGFSVNAQNKKHDWSIGVNGGLYSYSSILEKKLTNPYEYSIGANLTVSRYLNNHFDLTLQGNRVLLLYPTNTTLGEPFKYDRTTLYGANFTLKYKIDNGYILKEHTMFAPYFTLGLGASKTPISNINYVTPVGLGVTVNLSDRTSLIFDTQYNRDIQSSLSYLQYNAGLKIHFGKANKKRVKATRQRDKKRKYAKIRKYREQQRIAQAEKAKQKLQAMKAQGLISNIPTIEQDEDLLLTNEPIVLKPEDKVIEIKIEENIPPSKPKMSSITKKKNNQPVANATVQPINTEPSIPVSPGKINTEDKLVLEDSKPPISKPNSNRSEIIAEAKPDIVEEATPNVVEKPQPIEKPSVAEKPQPIEKPSVVEKPQPIEKPSVVEKPTKEKEKLCKNSELELSTIGKNINFDSDRYRIRSRMHADLKKIIDILNECEEYSYVIIAHTDSDGDAEYNKKLANQRALAIKNYLISKGIDGTRLTAVAYGSSVPIVPNTSTNNKAKNRRIEFRLNRTSFDE